MDEIVTCKSCFGRFEVVEVGGGMTSPELEPLKCPHCGHQTLRLAQGRLRTRPVPKTNETDKK
jgi:Zn finger protein HypA/HybF involved in hydrogenase expression